MKTDQSFVGRRAFLKGVGTTLFLPWLESIPAFGASARLKPSSQPPTRFAALYFPNGVEIEQWGATGEDENFQLSRILQPLEAVKRKVIIPSGLWHERLDSRSAHSGKTSGFLSGVENYKIEGNRLRVGASLDQLMAEKIGSETPLPSLCLGIKPDSKIQTDYSSVYRSYISWKSPSQPAGKEIDPRFAFDLLFADKEKQQRNKSILDAVHDQAKDLQRHVSLPDREKLDEFLTSVREVEDRIDQADRAGAERWTPAEGVPQPARPDRMPEDRQEHVRLMLDLIVLAFQMNQTRIATFMFENGGCSGNFSFLPGVTEQWHATSHHQDKPEIKVQYEAINRWHVEQLAYFLERMDSIHEGEGTLLDHSMIVMGSGLKDGNKHTCHDLPLIFAGSGSGTIRTGLAIAYPQDTPLAGLYLSIAERMGAPLESLADISRPLGGLA
jgi:hypothetical protein